MHCFSACRVVGFCDADGEGASLRDLNDWIEALTESLKK